MPLASVDQFCSSFAAIAWIRFGAVAARSIDLNLGRLDRIATASSRTGSI